MRPLSDSLALDAACNNTGNTMPTTYNAHNTQAVGNDALG